MTIHVPTAERPHPPAVVRDRAAPERRPVALLGADQERLWLGGALLLTLLFTARTMAPALVGAVQDDALQHVFWTLRYRDPELFPGDLYADYFQSLSPAGYAALYWLLARVIDPLLASKLIPPVLGLVTAVFTFLFVRKLHPSPAAAFLATVLTSWYVWQYDDVVSATPRAFVLPTLAALLWALAAGRLAIGVGVAVLAALLYPLGGVLAVALFGSRLVRFQGWRPTLARERAPWLAAIAATALVGAVLLPEVLQASPYGPTVTAAEARTMPEFGEAGRNAFFVDDPYWFWLESYRSGLNLRSVDALFPGIPILFEAAALALLLPLVLALRRRLPAARALDRRAGILAWVLALSFGLFFLAHLALFHLYLPARYVQWTVPLVVTIAGGLALAILCEAAASRLRPARPGPLAASFALLLAAGLVTYPAKHWGGFQVDQYPTVTAYLRAQPKDVLVATVPANADALAAMSERRVLVGREYALAYHEGYYAEVRQRTIDLIEAYYDEGARRLNLLVDRYGVDYFLVDRNAYAPERVTRAWGSAFEPYTTNVRARLDRPRRYALQDLMRRCAVVDDGRVALVPATCLTTYRP